MSGISNAFIAGRMLQPLRCLAALLLVCLGLGATSSYAQTCDQPVITRSNETRVTIPFKTGSITSETILDSGAFTATYSNCTGFNNTSFNWLINHPNIFPFTSTSTISFDTSNVSMRVFAQCKSPSAAAITNNCVDANNANVVSSALPTSGISLNARYTIRGLNSNNQNCISITNAAAGFNSSVSSSAIASTATGCVSITITIIVTIRQNAIFLPSNVVRLFAATAGFISVRGNFSTANMGFNNSSPINLIPQSSTCALSLSNTSINFGNISSSLVSSAAPGATLVSKPFRVSIGNCSGFPAGKNKILKWDFKTPNANNTLMENETILSGGASGLSAQIQADQRLDFATPPNVLSNIVTSGQSYITSGTTSDNQTLNYQVNIVRNNDAVQGGGFLTAATVTLSYK